MQEILDNYPWMIYAVIGCLVILFILIIGLAVTKKEKSDSNEDKLISDYLKEEKKAAKKAEIEEEYKEIVEAQQLEKDKRTFVSSQPDVIEEIDDTQEYEEIDDTQENVEDIEESIEELSNETESEEENEEMIKKRITTTRTKTRRTTSQQPAKTTVAKAPVAQAQQKRIPNGKYEVFQVSGNFQYILKASNGEKLIESKKYSTKDNVLNAIEAVKRTLEADGKTAISKDKSGFFQFKLTAANNRPLATSANYSSEQNAKNALNSFKRFALSSPIVEVDAPDTFLGEIIEVTTQDLKVNGKLQVSGKGKEWVFKLSANNGELLCTSQIYTSKDNCQKGVDTLKTNINEGKFEVVKDKNNLYQFKLFSKANRLIAIGQTYEDKQRAINSANSVASFINNTYIK